jgi:hypothetical protein
MWRASPLGLADESPAKVVDHVGPDLGLGRVA